MLAHRAAADVALIAPAAERHRTGHSLVS
jgi:hypothetical protein